MDKNDILNRTRLQQAGKAITDMIKECKIDLEEARKGKFAGAKNGYVFKMDSHGLGYYLDNKSTF